MLDPVANLIKLTVSTGYAATDTSIAVTSGGSTLPTPSFNMVWWNYTDFPDPSDDPNVEIVRVTGVSGNTLTITRAQETSAGGPAASTKNTAGKTYKLALALTAKMVTDIQSLIGNPSWNRTTVSDANYSIQATDSIIAYSSLTATRTVTLPTAVGVAGKLYIIKDESGLAQTYNITVVTTNGQTIDGVATKLITNNNGYIGFYSDGASWRTFVRGHAFKAPGPVTGTINSVNTVFTLPWTPQDPNSIVLYLNQQPFLSGVHFTITGNQATYFVAPNIGFVGTGHYATGI